MWTVPYIETSFCTTCSENVQFLPEHEFELYSKALISILESRCGSYKPWKCPGIRRSCHDHRYKVLEKDCDGNDQFTLGWEQFINGITYDNTTNTTDPDLPTYTNYFIKLKQVVDDDKQKGPQKASKLCQLQDELKGKLTGPNQDKVARILYGNWGHAKKFCECQGCSSECNTTCTMGGCSKGKNA